MNGLPHQSPPSRFNRARPGRRAGTALPVLAAILASPLAAWAEPQGWVVKQGDATVSAGGSRTTIDQRSSKAIIDWQKFGLEAHESAVFNQPGSNAIALNRVTGGDPSNILGTIRANGQVWLVNRNGVMFGKSATVDVHGLVATTADIPDASFMADDFNFSLPSTEPTAAVANEGSISFGERGLTALVGSNARNAGTIVGRLGSVVIAGAPTFTIALDPQDGGLIQFAATSKVTSKLTGEPLVENSGVIHNDGGLVRLTASAAAGVVDEAINMSGLVEAHGLALQDGRVELVSDTAGRVVVQGTLDVGAGEAGGRDGSVVMRGEGLSLTVGAAIQGSSAVDLAAQHLTRIDGTIISSDSIALAGEHITIGGAVAAQGDVRLQGKFIATAGDGEITANRLDVASTAPAHHPAGGGVLSVKTDVNEIAIGKTKLNGTHFREATVTNDGDLMVSQIDNSGIDVGRLELNLDGTLTVNRPIQASAAGDAVVVVTGRFVNGVGADALQTPQGRALVYSTDPNADSRGDLGGSLLFDRNFVDAPPETIGISGNVFIYSGSETVTPSPPPPLSPAPSPPEPTQPAELPASQPQLTAFQIVQVTQPTVAPANDSTNAVGTETRLIRLPSGGPNSDHSDDEDLLFANDGNRELWGLGGGR